MNIYYNLRFFLYVTYMHEYFLRHPDISIVTPGSDTLLSSHPNQQKWPERPSSVNPPPPPSLTAVRPNSSGMKN